MVMISDDELQGNINCSNVNHFDKLIEEMCCPLWLINTHTHEMVRIVHSRCIDKLIEEMCCLFG